MPTTFDVIYLGNLPLVDEFEGDTISEFADDLKGLTFGDPLDPLCEHIYSFSPAGWGFEDGRPDLYDTNNSLSDDMFSIDGGPPQIFNSALIYYATITYTDGSTAHISAVIFQDIHGETFLAPEISANSDALKLSAKPIESLTLDFVATADDPGLIADRHPGNFVVCFARGTLIETPRGPKPIETLCQGDLVLTADHGARPIRWIGVQRCTAKDDIMVDILPGALRNDLPKQRLRVSKQHRILVRSRVTKRMFDTYEVLIAAHRLVGLPGITFAKLTGTTEFWHFLFDQHELICANGAPAETLLMGTQAQKQIGARAMGEIAQIDPNLITTPAKPARYIPTNKEQKKLAERILKNRKQVIEQPSTPFDPVIAIAG